MQQRLPDYLVEVLRRTRQIAASTPLWPAWDPTATPLVFHSPAGAYLIGHPSPPDDYEALEPADGRSVHAGPTSSAMGANTAGEVFGVLSAMMILPADPPTDPDRLARLILHECFHAHQEAALSKVAKPNYYVSSLYPEYDPVNNALSVVENRLLARALAVSQLTDSRPEHAHGMSPALPLAPALDSTLTSPTGPAVAPAEAGESTQAVEAAAAAFMAVRLSRHERLTGLGLGNVARYEAESEFNEGTPTYVEMRAGHPMAELISNLQTLSRGGSGNSYLRYYSTGAASALLLDRLAPDWHQALAGGGETLQSLLHARLAGVLPEVRTVLAEAGYEVLLAEEERLEAERKQQIARLMARIQDGPGVLVEILIGGGIGVLFNPRAIITVRPGVKLHPTHSGLSSASGVSGWFEHLCLEEREPRRLLLRLPHAPVNQAASGLHLTAKGFELKSPTGTIETMGDGYLQIDLL